MAQRERGTGPRAPRLELLAGRAKHQKVSRSPGSIRSGPECCLEAYAESRRQMPRPHPRPDRRLFPDTGCRERRARAGSLRPCVGTVRPPPAYGTALLAERRDRHAEHAQHREDGPVEHAIIVYAIVSIVLVAVFDGHADGGDPARAEASRPTRWPARRSRRFLPGRDRRFRAGRRGGTDPREQQRQPAAAILLDRRERRTLTASGETPDPPAPPSIERGFPRTPSSPVQQWIVPPAARRLRELPRPTAAVPVSDCRGRDHSCRPGRTTLRRAVSAHDGASPRDDRRRRRRSSPLPLRRPSARGPPRRRMCRYTASLQAASASSSCASHAAIMPVSTSRCRR